MTWNENSEHPLPPTAGCLRVHIISCNGREWLALVGTRHKLIRAVKPYQMTGEQWQPYAANDPPSVRLLTAP